MASGGRSLHEQVIVHTYLIYKYLYVKKIELTQSLSKFPSYTSVVNIVSASPLHSHAICGIICGLSSIRNFKCWWIEVFHMKWILLCDRHIQMRTTLSKLLTMARISLVHTEWPGHDIGHISPFQYRKSKFSDLCWWLHLLHVETISPRHGCTSY